MLTIGKRAIAFITFLLLIVACTTASPTTVPNVETVSTPVAPTLEQPTAILMPTQAPTTVPIPIDTKAPSPTPLPLGGSGEIVFGSNRDGDFPNIYLLTTSDGNVTRLTLGDSNTFPGPFSPNGSQLLFTGFGLTNSFVGLMNADGTDPVDLSGRPTVDEGFPTWSPDGQQIAFTSRLDGNNEIYIMNADGTNIKRITNNHSDDFAPAWSPDGSQIAFVSDRDNLTGVNNLYLMNVDGSGIVRLTNGNEIDYGPAWSPDEK